MSITFDIIAGFFIDWGEVVLSSYLHSVVNDEIIICSALVLDVDHRCFLHCGSISYKNIQYTKRNV